MSTAISQTTKSVQTFNVPAKMAQYIELMEKPEVQERFARFWDELHQINPLLAQLSAISMVHKHGKNGVGGFEFLDTQKEVQVEKNCVVSWIPIEDFMPSPSMVPVMWKPNNDIVAGCHRMSSCSSFCQSDSDGHYTSHTEDGQGEHYEE